MRGQIFDALFEQMVSDETLFLVTGDMGINLIERFEESFPQRYLNVGIAEQNLVGVGAGLCNAGFRPVLYTISNFMVHRCLEQIRNDIAIHGYPITLLGTSTRYDNAPLGPTHHILDDWGALHTIPGIDIYCPADADYASQLLERVLAQQRPAYVRIPKGEPHLHNGQTDVVRIGCGDSSVGIIGYGSTGPVIEQTVKDRPETNGWIVQCLRPLDERTLVRVLEEHEAIGVVEDHFGHCGLYAQLCELAIREQISVQIKSLAPQH